VEVVRGRGLGWRLEWSEVRDATSLFTILDAPRANQISSQENFKNLNVDHFDIFPVPVLM